MVCNACEQFRSRFFYCGILQPHWNFRRQTVAGENQAQQTATVFHDTQTPSAITHPLQRHRLADLFDLDHDGVAKFAAVFVGGAAADEKLATVADLVTKHGGAVG